ncbi:flavin monoamine oxidase family protein [Rhodococcus sp. NBC_00294]|uniref:flavin monoamine oxidase family protein n=1 Tax=Rhodococcus sp. NBC_00294 TaxID=2976004 RepID=UPI002E2A21B7|nr:FAD-dependent oxidoreductase [Rhodococcus sp. NBC_00294]
MSGDVVVIGAGLSGLVAALDLTRAGRSVIVLEAADRIGGKVLTVDTEGHHVDHGAHWIGGDQTAVRALAAEFGVDTAPEPRRRRGADEVFAAAGRVHRYHGQVPRIPVREWLPVGSGIARLDLAVRTVDRAVPLLSTWRPGDHEMSDVLARRMFPSAYGRDILTCFFRLIFGADPDEVPARAALEYLRAAGSLRAIAEVRDGAQERYFVDGTASLISAVAQHLSAPPETSRPVIAIRPDTSGVDVVTADGTVRASSVVLAVPLPRAADIDGALPAGLGDRMRTSRMGEYAKTIVVYDSPWWRENGLTGTALDVDGPVQMIVDGNAGRDSPGILVAFSGGRAAADLFSRTDRRDIVVAELVRLFGPRARSPRRVDDITWSAQPWLGGAPTAIPPYGGVFHHQDLTTDRVHWAGTDLADRWPGYLDGAVRSGRRAAREILTTSRGGTV